MGSIWYLWLSLRKHFFCPFWVTYTWLIDSNETKEMKTHCFWYYCVTATSVQLILPLGGISPISLSHEHCHRCTFSPMRRETWACFWQQPLAMAEKQHWWPQGTYQILHSDTTGTTAPERKTRQNHHLVKIRGFAFNPAPCVTQWNYNIPGHYLPSSLEFTGTTQSVLAEWRLLLHEVSSCHLLLFPAFLGIWS